VLGLRRAAMRPMLEYARRSRLCGHIVKGHFILPVIAEPRILRHRCAPA
jgi:hypothetical protein